MANISALAAAFKASLNPDPAVRQPAQASLEAGCATPGALVSLLSLSSTAGVEQDVAMAAAVLFKNEVKKRWAEGPTGVSDGEKQAIRQHIIGIICGCSIQLQPIFREAMRRICLEDCLGAWPTAVEECGARCPAALRPPPLFRIFADEILSGTLLRPSPRPSRSLLLCTVYCSWPKFSSTSPTISARPSSLCVPRYRPLCSKHCSSLCSSHLPPSLPTSSTSSLRYSIALPCFLFRTIFV